MKRKYLLIVALATSVVLRNYFLPPTHKNSDSAALETTAKLTKQASTRVKSFLPPAQAGLLLGMTIGTEDIKKDKVFYDKLIQIGLVHVVVVSGYNVSLVIKGLTKVLKEKSKFRNNTIVLIFLVLYTLVCGGEAPVIRASIMGYIVYISTAKGKKIDALTLLITVGLIMLLIFPEFLESLSFWLSVTSTLGLMLLDSHIASLFEHFKPTKFLKKFLPIDDLATTLACQLTVWPLISYFFGRVSLASPLYNMAILWLVPLCTVQGFLFLMVVYTLATFATNLVWIVFPPFDIFVRAVDFFSSIDHSNLEIKINLAFMVVYYAVLVWIVFQLNKGAQKI